MSLLSLAWRAVGLWFVGVGGAGLVRPKAVARYQLGKQLGTVPDDVEFGDGRILVIQIVGGLVALLGVWLVATGRFPL